MVPINQNILNQKVSLLEILKVQRENDGSWPIDRKNKNVQNSKISNCRTVELDELL